MSDKIVELNTSKIKIDSNSVQAGILTAVGNGFGSNKFFRTSGNQSDGGIERFVASNNIVLFYPIGTSSFYTPVSATVSGVSSTDNQGYLQVSVNNAELTTLSFTGVANSALDYYCRVRGNQFVSMPTVTYIFNSSVSGIWPSGTVGTPNNYVGGKVVVPNRYAETTSVAGDGLVYLA